MPKKLEKFLTQLSNLGKSKKKGTAGEVPTAKIQEDLINACFLSKNTYKHLYAEADRLAALTESQKIAKGFRPDKVFHKPIEQLSPLGLGIMSHLYAQKDNDPRQPLIASTIAGLKHLVKMMDDAPFDSEVTVIFQPMNLQTPKTFLETAFKDRFSPVHKTVIKIKKTEAGFELLSLDGTNNRIYSQLTISWILDALHENGNTLNDEPHTGKKHINVRGAFQINPLNAANEPMGRQTSDFECGVFAIKDAREMNKDPELMNSIMDPKFKKDETQYEYEIPTVFFKSAQSSALRKEMKEHSDEVVTGANPESADPRKHTPRTLEQTYAHHQEDYIYHFSKKFHDAVLEFAKQNAHNPQAVFDAATQYDAGNITAEKLEIYRLSSPQLEMKERLEAVERSFASLSVPESQSEETDLRDDVEKPAVTIHLPENPTETPPIKPSNKPS